MKPEHVELIEKLFSAKLQKEEHAFILPPGKYVNLEAFAVLIAAIEAETDALAKHCEEYGQRITELERENAALKDAQKLSERVTNEMIKSLAENIHRDVVYGGDFNDILGILNDWREELEQ